MPIAPPTPSIAFVTRIALVLAGLGAIGWALAAMPSFWAERELRGMAGHIIEGQTYKADVMDAADHDIADHLAALRPSMLEDVAIFRQRQAEIALVSGNVAAADPAVQVLGQSVDRALENTPGSPFLWLMRFWTKSHQDGFDPSHLADLERSYALGPNEAWVAIKRCRLAFAIFQALPDQLQKLAVGDFVRLVNSGVVVPATEILTGPGASIRQVLLNALSDLSESRRRSFAEFLYSENPNDFAVPGIAQESTRPWQR